MTLLLPNTPEKEAHKAVTQPVNRTSTPEKTVFGEEERTSSAATSEAMGLPASAMQEETATRKRRREESESSLEDEAEEEEAALKMSRLDSTFSEASVDGEGLSKKRRRKHKRKRRASVADQLRGLNLRVMSK